MLIESKYNKNPQDKKAKKMIKLLFRRQSTLSQQIKMIATAQKFFR